jgi:hypothetical protein
MTRSSGRHHDPTADLAVSDLSSEYLFAEILARIQDRRERVLVLAHFGLGMTLSTLARTLGGDQAELARRVETILAVLRTDDQLASAFGDIRRAGRAERYQALAYRLDLLDWFCSQCGEFMIQPNVGRPRTTCSRLCRVKFHRAGRTGWKDLYQDSEARDLDSRSKYVLTKATSQVNLGTLGALMTSFPRWWWNGSAFRDRALLLLGFTCPLPVCPSDLAALDVDDVTPKPPGLEIRLYKRAKKTTRYVMIPANTDPVLDPVEAVLTWRTMLIATGRTTGPMFIRTGQYGKLPNSTVRLTAQAVATIIAERISSAKYKDIPPLETSTQLPDLLEALSPPPVGETN